MCDDSVTCKITPSSLLFVFLFGRLGLDLALLVLCLVGKDRICNFKDDLVLGFNLGLFLLVGVQLESEHFGDELFAFEVGLEVRVGLRASGGTMRRRWGKEVPK
jgi:hypothetical protein